VSEPLLDIEVLVLGSASDTRELEPWRKVCAEAARVVWTAQTELDGELAMAIVPGPATASGGQHRAVVGAYSPETRTVLVFIEAQAADRRERSWLRQLLRTTAHEVTHAVQHRANPALRPGRRGPVMYDPDDQAGDRLERSAEDEAAALDQALFSAAPPAGFDDRARSYHGGRTARLAELIEAVERRGSV